MDIYGYDEGYSFSSFNYGIVKKEMLIYNHVILMILITKTPRSTRKIFILFDKERRELSVFYTQ